MDLSNRPYKGLQAEQEERAGLYEPLTTARKDTVVEAGTNCIIVGLCTCFLGFGFLFFIAAFVLGIYAMATDRMRQGILLSISSLALGFIAAFVGYIVFVSLIFGLLATLVGMSK